MSVAVTCVALLGALLFGLGMNVTRLRSAAGPDGQFPADPRSPLLKAIRAHGNAAEYIPMLAILMLLVQSRDSSTTADVACVVATGARIVHAAGLLTAPSLAERYPVREVGAVGTYIAGLALCVLAALTL